MSIMSLIKQRVPEHNRNLVVLEIYCLEIETEINQQNLIMSRTVIKQESRRFIHALLQQTGRSHVINDKMRFESL